jgi:hypothetical protein
MIWKFEEPMALAAVITPRSTSAKADSTIRATKGAAAMERGIMAAVGPMLVRTINLERGMRSIIRMMKGRDRSRFTSLERTLYRMVRGANPPGEALKRKAPKGKPMQQARAVETRVIYRVSRVGEGRSLITCMIFSGMDHLLCSSSLGIIKYKLH